MRALTPGREWKTGAISLGFWAMNGGLLAMVTLSLLPIGVAQRWTAIDQGTWWARSAGFLDGGALEVLRWMRIPGDTVFAVGALAIGWFMFGPLTGRSFRSGAGIVEAGRLEAVPEERADELV